ncbi:MAG TPA: hypothetical protein PKD18_23700 [Saprospiraceae bacterium]|nr:hypothetical protein [Saprospiraceae bacterium]
MEVFFYVVNISKDIKENQLLKDIENANNQLIKTICTRNANHHREDFFEGQY